MILGKRAFLLVFRSFRGKGNDSLSNMRHFEAFAVRSTPFPKTERRSQDLGRDKSKLKAGNILQSLRVSTTNNTVVWEYEP